MKFVVDEYPNYNTDCPFHNYDDHLCRVTGHACPNTYERPIPCALITHDELMKKQKEGSNDADA